MKAFAPEASSLTAVKPGTVQRSCGAGKMCDCAAHEKDKAGTIQRRAAVAAPATAQAAVSPSVASGIQSASKSGGQGLPTGVRRQMEAGFGGRDLSGVRVHHDAQAHRLADSLEAQAFTTGQDIFFAANRYQPDSAEGQRLLAHELTHTLQQAGSGFSGVQPSLELGAVDTPAEREADQVADAMFSGSSCAPSLAVKSTTVQRFPALAGVAPGAPKSQALVAGGKAITLPASVPFELPAEKADSDQDLKWLLGVYKTAANNHRLRTTHAGRRAREVWDIWAAGRQDNKDTAAKLETEVRNKTCAPDHIVELQIGGSDNPNNLRLLDRARNSRAGTDIWNNQLNKLITQNRIDRDTGWLEFTEVKPVGSVAAATGKGLGGRPTNDPVCMGRDPINRPGGNLALDKNLRPFSFVAGGVPIDIAHDGGGKISRDHQLAIAGAQMERVTANGSMHRIDAIISPYNHKFPVQKADQMLVFETTGPQGDPLPTLKLVTKPPGTIRLDFPFMSPAFLTPRLEEGQWRASGDMISTKPILKAAKIHFELADGELTGGVKVDAAALKAAMPISGLTLDPVSLEIGILNGDWNVTGGFGFRYASLAKGSLTASFSEKNGMEAEGIVDLLIPGLNEAHGAVRIRNGVFEGEILLGTKQLPFPFVDSANARIAIAGGELAGSGTVILKIPGLKDARLDFAASSDGTYSLSGHAKGSIPTIKDLAVDFGYSPTTGIFARGQGGIGIPGLDVAEIKVLYEKGQLSGSLKASYNKGRLSGNLEVWLSPDQKIGGHGDVTYVIAPGLPVFVGLDVLEDGSTKFAAGFKLPDPLVLFSEPKPFNKKLLDPSASIPLFGFPGVDLEAVVGASLTVEAGIGPAVIRGAQIASDFDPSRDDQELSFSATGKLELPAHAGVKFTVYGGLGLRVLIARATGTIGFNIEAGVCGAITADVMLGYKAGKFDVTACACLLAQPFVEAYGTANVRVFLDVLVGTIDLYEHEWRFGDFQWGGDFTVGILFPFHYSFGDGLDVAADNVKFIYPDITIPKLLEEILPA